jgi:hypothetical protein
MICRVGHPGNLRLSATDVFPGLGIEESANAAPHKRHFGAEKQLNRRGMFFLQLAPVPTLFVEKL